MFNWWGCDALETGIIIGAIVGLLMSSWIPLMIGMVIGAWWENVR